MPRIRIWIAHSISLALALGAAGCARHDQSAPLAPEPASGQPPAVTAAHWVWDRVALGSAIAEAARSPLVERALRDAPEPSLPLVRESALLAEGTLEDGSAVTVTILPYAADGDRSRATFVSLLRRGDAVVAQRAEVIAGRAPFDNEAGFQPFVIGSQTVWEMPGAAYRSATGGGAALAPERMVAMDFLACFIAHQSEFHDMGANMAIKDAPDVPYAGAAGGVAGTAAGAVYCGVRAWLGI